MADSSAAPRPAQAIEDIETQLSAIDSIDEPSEETSDIVPKTEASDVVVDVQMEERPVHPNEQLVEVTRIVHDSEESAGLMLEDDLIEDDEDLCSAMDESHVLVDSVGSNGKNIKSIQYVQRYRNEWESEDFCKEWISPYPQNEFMAWCRACNRNLFSRKNDLFKHNASQRHKENMEIFRRTGTPGESSKKFKANCKFSAKLLEHPNLRRWLRPVPNSPHRSWCSLCACFLAPQLNGLIMHSKSMKHRRNSKQRPTMPPTALEDGSLGASRSPIVIKNSPVVAPASRVDGKDPHTPRRYHKRIRKPKRPWTPTEDADDHTPTALSVLELECSDGSENEESELPPPETDFSDRVTFSIGLGGRKVGFLGAGQMAQSLAQGMLDQGLLSPLDVLVSAPTNRHMAIWRRWKCQVVDSNDELVQQSDIIVLAVKASVLAKMVAKLEPVSDGRSRLFISVIPGVARQRVVQLLSSRISNSPPASTDCVAEPMVRSEEEEKDPVTVDVHAAEDQSDDPPGKAEDVKMNGEDGASVTDTKYDADCLHVVRCAPNKMMAIGAGFCAYCMGGDLPHSLYLAIETIFSSLGTCVEVDESLMDAYTTVVGCGSAFTCAFVEALVQGTVSLDVPWDEALKAATCVVLGTAKMLLQSGRQPAELRRAISTPGGSTIAGVAALQRAGIEDTVVSAMEMACRKTSSIGSHV